MARALDIAFAAVCLAMASVVLIDFPEQKLPDSGSISTTAAAATTTTATTQVCTTSTDQILLPLAAALVALLAAVALICRHLQQHHHAPAGGDRRRVPEVLTFTLLASAAFLQYVFFVRPQPAAGVAINVVVAGARARALGLAAARMMPAAAAVTFFTGIALALVCVRDGGDDEPAVARVLSKVVVEAAAVLVCLMAMALCTT